MGVLLAGLSQLLFRKVHREESMCLIIRPLIIWDLTDSLFVAHGIVHEREIYSVEVMLYFSYLDFFE